MRAGPAPAIDGAACSLGRLAQSGCAACAAACPRGALQDSAEGLVLDALACSGCGACVAACPQRAITVDGASELRPEKPGQGAVALVCPRRSAEGGICLQALGLEALAGLWLAGVRRVLAVTGACAECPDGRGLDVATRVAAVDALLAERGLPGLRVDAAAGVPRGVPRLVASRPQARGRRAFLGLGTGAAPEAAPGLPALARLQSLSAPATARVAFAPMIDPASCTGCDACLRICPEGVLSLIKDDAGEMSYVAQSFQCTGCRLCMDVCGAEALTLDRLALPAPEVPLSGFRCRGCGLDVHVPADGPHAGGGLCPVCAATGHHRRLFVVLS